MAELQETSVAARPQNLRCVLRCVLYRNLKSKEAAVPDDDDDLGARDDPDTDVGGVSEVGMVLKTQQEVSRFYKRYACRVVFGVFISRSSFTKDRACLSLNLMCCKGYPAARNACSASAPDASPRFMSSFGGWPVASGACLPWPQPSCWPSMARFLGHYHSGVIKRAAGRNEDSEGRPTVVASPLHPPPAETDKD